jgi:hypothetical protein
VLNTPKKDAEGGGTLRVPAMQQREGEQVDFWFVAEFGALEISFLNVRAIYFV